jgi:hypothetical protein
MNVALLSAPRALKEEAYANTTAGLAFFGSRRAAGCASLSQTTDEDARGVCRRATLLDSNREVCAGPVAIDDRVIAGAREDLVVQRGENATFQIDTDDLDEDENENVEIRWTCVGDVTAERDAVRCPDETSHVRVTRATGNDFLLECYGNRGSSTSRARR